jgi:hypothetical protein
MAVSQQGLGALARTRRAYVKTMRANATRVSFRTQKAQISAVPVKQSAWKLAGVEARAFCPRGRAAILRQIPLRTTMFLALTVYERRTHPSGQAVCLLGLRRVRLCVGLASLVLLICVAGAISPYAGGTLALILIALLLPGSIGGVRRFPERRHLGRLTPPKKHIFVHSLASTLPGAGADLLGTLTREADERGWPLVLDADNERLTRYYADFGFVALATAIRTPDGSGPVRMWRRPSPLEGGRRDD